MDQLVEVVLFIRGSGAAPASHLDSSLPAGQRARLDLSASVRTEKTEVAGSPALNEQDTGFLWGDVRASSQRLSWWEDVI